MLHVSPNSLLPAFPRGTGEDRAWGVQAVVLTAPPGEAWCSPLHMEVGIAPASSRAPEGSGQLSQQLGSS